MCRMRPGPRCSNGALKRYNKAKANFDRVKTRYDAAKEADRLTARLRTQMSRATLRKNAADRVIDMTPAGHDALRDKIAAVDEQLPSRTPRAGSQARAAYDTLLQRRRALSARLQKGIASREGSYRDLAMVKNERSRLRAQALARGGEMGPNGHPLSEEKQALYRGVAQSLNLQPWTASQVKDRASAWVEHGANPAYHREARLRPPTSARDSDGRMVMLGEKVDGEAPFSKVVRVNTPDGQVVEGRHDVFLTKNEDGKYVVSVRSTVASSWEDASPIDVTKQGLGHILRDRANGSTLSHKFVVGEFTSKAEAKSAVTRTKRDFDVPSTTALMGRDILVTRAGTRSSGLQRRGIVVWHRYLNPERS